jgi:hypothetical protein
LFRDANCPLVMRISAIGECDEETGIRDPLHARENPFRFERSRGPRTTPARRMNDRCAPDALALSNCSRTMRPCETPDRTAVFSSQSESSLLRRTVIV